MPRLLDDGQDVIHHRVFDQDGVRRVLQAQDIFRHQAARAGFGQRGAGLAHDFALAGRVRVADAQPHEEAVQLRFRQRVSAVMLHRILRGDHHERARQRMRMSVDGHLTLVHGFQQRGLRFGSGAVDFIGQQEVSEDGPRLELEGFGLEVIDGDAEHVARQHVAGELQAVEAAGDRARQGLRQSGFADAGNVFDQQVTARQQADQRKPDDFRLAANRRPEHRFELVEPGETATRDSSRRSDQRFPLGHYKVMILDRRVGHALACPLFRALKE